MILCFLLLVLKQVNTAVVVMISTLCAKLCVLDVVKNSNVKVFSLVSRTKETMRIEWHETCKCKCRFNSSDSNNKHRLNDDKCWCEWKELIDKGVCDKGFVWNPNNCELECYKSFDFSEYLHYKNANCEKCLVNKLTEKFTENIEETRLVKVNSTECNFVENKCKHNSPTMHIVLLSIIFTINVGIYFHWHLKRMLLVLTI